MEPRDPILKNELEEIGAIRIPNFLNEDSLLMITKLYEELELSDLGKIYSNVKDRTSEYNYRVDKTFKEIFAPAIAKHFLNYQLGGGAFLIKGTGEKSESSLHQDWNIVDESKYSSAAIFCPTQDVDEKNGCIQVIAGSHKWFKNIRSFEYPSPYLTFEQVNKGLVAIPAKAGDAIVFRHNVIHGSKPNLTESNRVAASMSIATKNADFLHYKWNGSYFDTIKANSDFFCKVVPSLYSGKKLTEKTIERTPFDLSNVLDSKDFITRYKKAYTMRWYESIINKFFD